jgi:hypothetical protein
MRWIFHIHLIFFLKKNFVSTGDVMNRDEDKRELEIIKDYRDIPPPNTDKFVSVNKVYDRTGQQLLKITFSTLEVKLLENEKKFGRQDSWVSPFGTLATILAALCTTTFNDSFGLSASTWQSVFIIGFFLALIQFIKSIADSFRSITVKGFINELKKDSDTEQI